MRRARGKSSALVLSRVPSVLNPWYCQGPGGRGRVEHREGAEFQLERGEQPGGQGGLPATKSPV